MQAEPHRHGLPDAFGPSLISLLLICGAMRTSRGHCHHYMALCWLCSFERSRLWTNPGYFPYENMGFGAITLIFLTKLQGLGSLSLFSPFRFWVGMRVREQATKCHIRFPLAVSTNQRDGLFHEPQHVIGRVRIVVFSCSVFCSCCRFLFQDKAVVELHIGL